MSDFLYKLKRVKLSDYLQIWKLPVSIIPAAFYKLINKDLWIICEDANEARDNGYWMFKYIRENHPEQNCVYAIKKASPDYHKVHELGKTVEYGSLNHWIQYLASSKKISSQKAGNPNAAIFYALEVFGILKDKRVFLQHGITINDAKWLYYSTTKMTRFICGAFPEFEYIKEKFGYPEGNVKYTGFCRFDRLHDYKADENLILIMPTWREWIADEDYRLQEYEGTTDIPKTNYFVQWTEFLHDPKIQELAEKYKVKFIFFPHRNMQKYQEYFPKSTEYLQVAFNSDYDIQDLMKRASLMITDYSSVCFDFFYMKKPLIFYQFDYEQFRKGQYGQGAFDYKNNGFAHSYEKKEDVFKELEEYIQNHFKVSEEYLEEHQKQFTIYDDHNCERVYDVIKEL
ncbi:MAG: CDP-glycerol glycerophosphotransferase family protein [Solobacterium sp.]|nr:CDP-glycerol glycerophosphotransferase family protein [Solobacterium sp.]